MTEPLKLMANPELARNADYAAMRPAIIAEAIRGYKMSIEMRGDRLRKDKEMISTWIHIALLHTVADDHSAAQEAYRTAIDTAEAIHGENPFWSSWNCVAQTHSHLAMELWDVGQREESKPHFRRASEAFRRASELAPDDREVLQGSAWFLSLCQDVQFRDAPSALEHARRLVSVTSEQENRRSYSFGRRPSFTLGLAEYRMGNLDAARKALERSIELREGGDAYESFVLAMVVARQGDGERARQLLRAARRMRKNRYSDFELHTLDAEAAAILGANDPSTP